MHVFVQHAHTIIQRMYVLVFIYVCLFGCLYACLLVCYLLAWPIVQQVVCLFVHMFVFILVVLYGLHDVSYCLAVGMIVLLSICLFVCICCVELNDVQTNQIYFIDLSSAQRFEQCFN